MAGAPGLGPPAARPSRSPPENRPMPPRSLAIAVFVVATALVPAAPSKAVDEIQVYNAEIAEVRQFTLQQHLNFGIRARRTADYPGALIANRTLDGTPEFAYGVT